MLDARVCLYLSTTAHIVTVVYVYSAYNSLHTDIISTNNPYISILHTQLTVITNTSQIE